QSASVVAARPANYWDEHITDLARHLDVPADDVTTVVADAAHDWNTEPRAVTDTQLANATAVRQRLDEATVTQGPEEHVVAEKPSTCIEPAAIRKDRERHLTVTPKPEHAPRR